MTGVTLHSLTLLCPAVLRDLPDHVGLGHLLGLRRQHPLHRHHGSRHGPGTFSYERGSPVVASV